MSIKPCIFVTKQGKEPTKDFLEAVVKKYPTAASAVLINATEMKRCTPKPIMEYSAEDFAGLVKQNAESRIAFWLCNTSDTMNEEDFQPYPLLTDPTDGTVHMYAYSEGDFTSYVKSEMNISPETHAINEWLIPKVKLLCEQYDDDLDKVLDYLQGEEGNKELQTEFFSDKRGALILMIVNRVEAFFHKNDVGRTEDWGYTSDACIPTPKKISKFSGGGTPAAKLTEKPAEVPSVAPAAKPSEGEPEGKWVAPSSEIQGNTQSKDWYWEITGMDKGSAIPKDILDAVLYKEPIFLPMLRFEAIRTRPIMKKTTVKQKPTSKDRTQSVATPDTKPQGTQTEPKHVQSGGSAVPRPVMSDATKSKMADLFLKPGLGKTLMDNRAKEGPTVEQLQNIMEKTKDFHSQLADKVKYDVEWSLTWPYEMHLDIGRTDYQGLAILSWYNGSQLLLAKAKILELEAKLAKALGNQGLIENKEPKAPVVPEKKKSRFAA